MAVCRPATSNSTFHLPTICMLTVKRLQKLKRVSVERNRFKHLQHFFRGFICTMSV